MSSRVWVRAVLVIAAVFSLSTREHGAPAVPPEACGWPCTSSLRCARPCNGTVKRVVTEQRVAAEVVATCAAQLWSAPDGQASETLLMAVSSYPHEDPDAVLAGLVGRLEASGQAGAAAGLAAQVALDRGALEEALAHLRRAQALAAPGCSVARIATRLAGLLHDAGQLGSALDAVQLGLDAVAPYGADGDAVRGVLQMTQTMLVEGIGDVDEALRRTDAMLGARPGAEQRAWLHAIRIDLLYVRHGPHQAEAELWTALAWAWVAIYADGATRSAVDIQSLAYYTLAGIRREQRRFEEADQALDLARLPGDPTAEVLYFRALINRDRGELARAEGGLEAALTGGTAEGDGKPPTGAMVTAIPIELARVRLAIGNIAGAEAALRDVLDEVEQLRASIPASDALMIAKHRQAYEELLGILARAGRWPDVLEVLARLDAGQFNSDVEAPATLPGRDRPAAPPSTPMWQPAVPDQPRPAASGAHLLAAWRGRHLVAVFRAGDELCRLEALDGVLRGACMGPSAVLERAAAALRADPNDVEAAVRVGAALIPHGTDALDLLLVGPIARTPIAALRDGRGLVVGRRPVQRVLGLLDDARAHGGHGAPRVVGFAGHAGTATAAEREAHEVARLLAVEAQVGAAATRASVTGGAPAVLHVAGHARLVGGVPELELADGTLSANAIAAQDHAPRLVVLASCESATATDEGGWGSLAAAFLHAGSERVIASDRAVDDEEAQALMRGFYRADGARDPARALGLSQAARAAALPADARPPAATTWAAFTVIAAPPRVPATR